MKLGFFSVAVLTGAKVQGIMLVNQQVQSKQDAVGENNTLAMA